MHIACPACSTRYVIPDSAVGSDGRVVRCAKCRHSWFQDASEAADAIARAPASLSAPVALAEVVEAPPAAPPIPAPADTSRPATYTPGTYADAAPAPDFAVTPSSFAHEPPFRPRRRRATIWLMALTLFALVVAGAIAAMANFGVPEWLPLPRTGFAQAQPNLRLNFPQSQQQWRPLPNGSSFFNVSGSIVNTSKERRSVPALEIVLRDVHHAVVYSLEATSPKPELAPGESETIDQAIIDAPKSANTATIGWKAR